MKALELSLEVDLRLNGSFLALTATIPPFDAMNEPLADLVALVSSFGNAAIGANSRTVSKKKGFASWVGVVALACSS